MSDRMGPPAPVVIVGAGPTGLTAATLLARRGVGALLLDRWDGVYPQPRAVHLDGEVRRILAGLGVDGAFAAITRPALGLRLVDRDLRVLSEFRRNAADGPNGYPEANLFDQPELEAVLRANLTAYPRAVLRGNAEVIRVENETGCVRVDFVDRGTGRSESVRARYVLGCDGANSVVRVAIGGRMQDLRFEQRWLVVDVACAVELGHWAGVHQLCDQDRAATYMRIGPTRHRWEFRLLPGESAAEYTDLARVYPLIAPWVAGASLHATTGSSLRSDMWPRMRSVRRLRCATSGHARRPVRDISSGGSARLLAE